MTKALLLAALMAAATTAGAQTEPEYRAEIGAGAGLVAYQGDMGGSLTKGMQPMFAIAGRYKWNPRTALAASVGFGKIKGDATGTDTKYPDPALDDYSFKSTLADVAFTFEYNFWPYGTGREYRGAVPLTPFIAIGLGAAYAKPSGGKSAFTAQLPIGAGVKYKIATRLNLALAWTMHFTLSDKLDGVQDPYTIESSGMFKNTDSYSTLQLSITYDFWQKCRVCHKE